MIKRRVEIPPQIAAKVLFAADRTCCVCRNNSKAIQIHHIDNNPSNNAPTNLAVLCFECHRETQIRGGFDRKLDPMQVILYRDDWHRVVAASRERNQIAETAMQVKASRDVAQAIAIAEIYRSHKAYDKLAVHYHYLGNDELRDKYIELAIKRDPTPHTIVWLRSLQRREASIPPAVVDAALAECEESSRPQLLIMLGRPIEAARAFLSLIAARLDDQNEFTAAFYLKELVGAQIIEALLAESFRKAADRDDLWWQVRALQELGWESELTQLVLKHASQIDALSVDDGTWVTVGLKILLAKARGETQRVVELERTRASLLGSWSPVAQRTGKRKGNKRPNSR